MFQAPQKSVVMISGGIDSTFLAYELRKTHHSLRAITLNYGQLNWINSLRMINRLSLALNMPVQIFDLPKFVNSFVGFMDPVYDGDLVIMCETMEPAGAFISIVSIAGSWAAAIGYDALIVGYNKDDREQDPGRYSQTKEAHELVAQAISIQARRPFQILMPLWETRKAEIIKMSHKANVPLASTWSCWRNNTLHCGKCPGCADRLDSFKASSVSDTTEYVV